MVDTIVEKVWVTYFQRVASPWIKIASSVPVAPKSGARMNAANETAQIVAFGCRIKFIVTLYIIC